MLRILFICHGNICRSPMAEFILKDMVKREGLEGRVEVDSAAVSPEELDNGVSPSARAVLRKHGVSVGEHRARVVTRFDYDYFHKLIAMEDMNLSRMRRILGNDPDGKFCRLLDFTAHPRNISDPYYTGRYDQAYEEIEEGCAALMAWIRGAVSD